MVDSSDQSSGFWTLTRPNKLSKRRNSDLHELHHKVFNIGVVGLSGTEKEKGPIGIGKSCLCNRFVRSAADDYHTDHISVLSQSDFGGHIVNNDHWLYWGSVIKSCDGYDLAFNVIEQTEFVDDICFQPFKSGKTEPYYKRCANTKLVSPEKLMYVCKDQLGIEREYEQRYLPDGKFNVDGFLCLFDVSEVHGRDIAKQLEVTNLILLNLVKTRKPIVFVTTKHDEANEVLVAEAERLVSQRDFRGLVPIVETSAQDNVNVNMAFLVCAQLIDKTRNKLRVPSYFEAYKNHLELLKIAGENYLGLIRSTVLDHRSSWQQVCIKLSHNPEFLQYTYLHGLDKAALVFKSHIKRLHEDSISHKVQHYLKLLPEILNEIIPCANQATNMNHFNDNNNTPDPSTLIQLNSSSPQSWELAKEYIKKHPSFDKYFISIPEGISWYDTELLQSSESRIPSDWLDSSEAYAIFQQRNSLIEAEQKRRSTREMFAQMLIDLKIPVGKPFIELQTVFNNDSNLEILSDQELFEIYVEYQNSSLQLARSDFQELLLENAEHLQQLTSSDKVIRQEDIKTINAILQHDERYQALDRFEQDRTLMMIRHLSFLHSQISEQCPSYPKCIEPEIERLLITKAKTLVSRYFENRPDKVSINLQKTCDLVIFGPRRPSQQLILALNVLNSRAPKQSQYQITFTVFDNADEIDSQIQRFKQSNTKPRGCFGIFTNERSLEHVSFTLEKFLILSAQLHDQQKNYFGSPPIVMLYAADITLDERTMLALENEGQQMADRFKCPFMNVTAIDQYRQHQQNNILHNEDSTSQVMSECASLDYACVDAAFNVLKEAISRRVCFMELYNNQELIPRQAFNPDAKILMCLLCGDPFSNEQFLWKLFLDYEDCYVTSSKSICLRVRLVEGHDKYIEVTIASYTHGAFNYKEDLLHGFILVCSTQRTASLAILNSFSFNIPCTPVLVLAVEDRNLRVSYGSSSDFDPSSLLDEARGVANRLNGHFEYVDLDKDLKQSTGGIKRINKFLQTVIERKPTIERAFELGDSDNLPPIEQTISSVAYVNERGIHDAPELSSMGLKYRNQSAGMKVPSARSSSKQTFQRKGLNGDDGLDETITNGPARNLNNAMRESVSLSQPTSNVVSSIQTQSPRQPRKLPQPRPRPLPNNRRFLDHAQSNDHHTATTHHQSELYAKRPLPPIPTSVSVSMDRQQPGASQATDRGTESSMDSHVDISTGSANINRMQKFAGNLASSKQSQSRQASSEDDHAIGDDNNVEDAGEVEEEDDDEQEDEEEDEALDSTSEDEDTGEDDSTENKITTNNNNKPKPGRLDLRQFDNITTAIGKLSVQTPPTSTATSSTSFNPTSVTSKPTPDTTPNNRRLPKNARHNHGRAVAPPKLPTSLLSRSKCSSPQPKNPPFTHESVPQSSNEDGLVDYSQSPIAQRLLKHSKGHKVSELNSPHDSDCEPHHHQHHNLVSHSSIAKSYESSKAQENITAPKFMRNSSIDSSELINSRGATIRQLNEILAKQPPGRPGGAPPKPSIGTRGSSLDQASPSAKADKDQKKDSKKKLRSDEKLEKRKLKEEERLRRQEEEKQRRQEKKLASKKSKSNSSNPDCIGDDGIPLFIKRCIEFIEAEGLDAEGIYRVPGNRAHVDAFFQKFKENPDMSILESDVPVNAVATALKDFLSKKWGPIIPLNSMNELTELSTISNREQRVDAVKYLIKKLPLANYRLLKYVFSHFVRVSLNHSLNSMDSKNLAICWWPTLLPLHFNDMVMFEQMRPHLEESIQTMIDRYDFIFDDEPKD